MTPGLAEKELQTLSEIWAEAEAAEAGSKDAAIEAEAATTTLQHQWNDG